jgi:hypothetical protein
MNSIILIGKTFYRQNFIWRASAKTLTIHHSFRKVMESQPRAPKLSQSLYCVGRMAELSVQMLWFLRNNAFHGNETTKSTVCWFWITKIESRYNYRRKVCWYSKFFLTLMLFRYGMKPIFAKILLTFTLPSFLPKCIYISKCHSPAPLLGQIHFLLYSPLWNPSRLRPPRASFLQNSSIAIVWD